MLLLLKLIKLQEMLRLVSQKRFKTLIEQILEVNELARDNDYILYGAVIKRIKGEQFMKDISLYDFLRLAAVDKTIPSITTATRFRSDIQKVREELRGETYDRRMKHSKDYKELFRK